MLRGRIDADGVARALSRERDRRMAALERTAGAWAQRMEAEARRDAPWQDRTGLARRSLMGVAGREGDVVACGVCGGAAYSPALELTNEGRGAILWPVVRKDAAQVMRDGAAAMR